MKYLQNKYFSRRLKLFDLDNAYVQEVLAEIFKGRSIPLGSNLYKIRAAQAGKGKSGGFRNLFYWKKDEFIIFCMLFAKNEKENITSKEFKELKILSDEYSKLTHEEVQKLIQIREFREVEYVEEEKKV